MITKLYESHTLEEVRQIMLNQHGFYASLRAYRSHLDDWGKEKSTRQSREESTIDSGSSTDTDSNIKYNGVSDDLLEGNAIAGVLQSAVVKGENAGRHTDSINVPIPITNSLSDLGCNQERGQITPPFLLNRWTPSKYCNRSYATMNSSEHEPVHLRNILWRPNQTYYQKPITSTNEPTSGTFTILIPNHPRTLLWKPGPRYRLPSSISMDEPMLFALIPHDYTPFTNSIWGDGLHGEGFLNESQLMLHTQRKDQMKLLSSTSKQGTFSSMQITKTARKIQQGVG